MRSTSSFLACLVAGLASAALGGCRSDVDERLALAGLSDACSINSDCSALLVCVFERCHQECETVRDCADGARCVQSDQRRNVCQLPDEQACGAGEACPGSQVCGVDAECRDACSSDRDCLVEQVCSSGTCADESEVDAEGRLPAEPERRATAPCVFDSDCPGSSLCLAGSCRAQCFTAADCRAGWSCAEGVCEAPGAPLPECLRSSDCSTGQHCARGACLDDVALPEPECSYDSDCAVSGQHCLSGSCTCECSTDEDCPTRTSCSDACACVPSGVINGNFKVLNEAQLRSLDDIVKITGVLTLAINATGEFHVPDVREVGSLSVNTNATYVLAALETVNDSYSCTGDCRAPRLKSVGDVYLNGGGDKIEFPSLSTMRSVSISSRSITSVAFPSLTSATNVYLLGNPRLTSFDAPQLGSVTRVTVEQSPRIARFHAPLLAPSAELTLQGCADLSKLHLPAVKDVETLMITGSPLLASLDLSGLRDVSVLRLYHLQGLTELELGSPQAIGSFSLLASGLSELPDLGVALKDAEYISISNNLSLSECAAKAFDARITDPPGSYTQSGNQACACAEQACCIGAACACGAECQ